MIWAMSIVEIKLKLVKHAAKHDTLRGLKLSLPQLLF